MLSMLRFSGFMCSDLMVLDVGRRAVLEKKAARGLRKEGGGKRDSKKGEDHTFFPKSSLEHKC